MSPVISMIASISDIFCRTLKSIEVKGKIDVRWMKNMQVFINMINKLRTCSDNPYIILAVILR